MRGAAGKALVVRPDITILVTLSATGVATRSHAHAAFGLTRSVTVNLNLGLTETTAAQFRPGSRETAAALWPFNLTNWKEM